MVRAAAQPIADNFSGGIPDGLDAGFYFLFVADDGIVSESLLISLLPMMLMWVKSKA